MGALSARQCNPKSSTNGWQSRCPAHDDQQPSLSISEGDDGRVLLHCHAGCSCMAVCEALGISQGDLFAKSESGLLPQVSSKQLKHKTQRVYDTESEAIQAAEKQAGCSKSDVWTYHYADGTVASLAVRFDDSATQTKQFRPITRTQDGKYYIGCQSYLRPLYQLPEILALPKGSTVYVCEGEKATDVARQLGLTATCSPQGCQAAKYADWSPLAGQHTVVFPDNDPAGELYAKDVERLAKEAGACSVSTIHLADHWPEMPRGGDLVEFLEHCNGDHDVVLQAITNQLNSTIASPASTQNGPVIISNFRMEVRTNDNGKDITTRIGVSAEAIQKQIMLATGGWPKRAGSYLFANDNHSPLILATPTQLFGYLAGATGNRSGINPIQWAEGVDKVKQAHFHSYLFNHAERYDFVESFPHWPVCPAHYYLHSPLPQSTGSHLQTLLSYFCPATPEDRELILAFLLTLVAGCAPGQRPAFLFTGVDGDEGAGRGVGKTTLVKVCSQLVGGAISLSPQESGQDFKKRLLSPSGLGYRVVIIDNIKSSKFSSADLEAMITDAVISGHALYVGEGRRPNHLVWCLTINGACLSKDIANRCVIVKLKRPTYQGNWESEVSNHIETNRWNILADLIALLKNDAPSFVPNTRWAAWEALVLSKVSNPLICQQIIAERQQDVDGDSEERELVRDEFLQNIRLNQHDPESSVLILPSRMTANWYASATGQPGVNPQKATTMIRTLGIPELTPYRRGNIRGFLWRGTNSDSQSSPILMSQ